MPSPAPKGQLAQAADLAQGVGNRGRASEVDGELLVLTDGSQAAGLRDGQFARCFVGQGQQSLFGEADRKPHQPAVRRRIAAARQQESPEAEIFDRFPLVRERLQALGGDRPANAHLDTLAALVERLARQIGCARARVQRADELEPRPLDPLK